ncbi:putative amidoligase domain-containing protein [Paenibacillus sp. YYML68]|uniref:putative amidoligase domain-containing protein n=1 Tax=Paenibacillus sp. YYML68 TaxID=2909250 RepID=UPI00248F98DD|nr:hypothetical protein [Paenibacillus sp. YYML68]
MRAYLLHSREPGLAPLLELLQIEHGTRLPSTDREERRIIYWGSYHPDKGDSESLQPVKSIVAALKPKRVAELLSLQGIDCRLEGEDASPGERWTHDYRVPVFHLQPLAVFHRSSGVFYSEGSLQVAGRRTGGVGVGSIGSGGGGAAVPMALSRETEYVELGTEQPGYYAMRAMREAVKTLYALGLDYGVVHVRVLASGALCVRSVEAIPELTPRLAKLFADAMNSYDKWLERTSTSAKRPVMLGADPEFLLVTDRGKVRFASQFVGKDGPFGCDAIMLPSRRKIFPLAELRPAPSTDVRRLIVHLHHTMQLAAKQITDTSLRWVAGGMPVRGFPLGGHIHFSGVELDVALLRALDNYIALPLTLLEDERTAGRKPQYGFLGDFRRQRHGGFEYRVLPSWLVSPGVAKGVLALAKLVGEHYRQLKARPLAESDVLKAYYRSDKSRIRPLLPSLWRDLERLPSYKEYESYLLPLRRMMLQQRAWNELDDIRPKWKITPPS